MPTVETPAISRSGITTSASGERHIPSSTRADGSIRKEIKVRPGYRPPEDVDVYKNRTAEGFRTRGKAGVPGAEGLKEEKEIAKGNPVANKNAKRREARKKAAAAAIDGKTGDVSTVAQASSESKEPAEPTKLVDVEADTEKEAKKLLKKLRQARDLKDKKEKGDVLLPEQFEKVIKINELMRQLESLGFNSEGEKKTET
jgi:partner of Y14 and mago protein